MKWKATHILKVNGDAPRRVMLNSSCLYSKTEWENGHATTFSFVNGRVYMAPDSLLRRNHPENEPDRMLIDDEASLTPIGEMKRGESTTSMRKAVSRITTDFKVKVAGKWRRLIVRMGPGDILTMRPEGCRSSSARTFDFGSAWGLAGKQMARKLVRERKEARKAKRAAA